MVEDTPVRKKTSKYFASSSLKEAASKEVPKDEKTPAKRKTQTQTKEEPKPTPVKKPHVEKKPKKEELEEDEDFVKPVVAKKSKGVSGTAVARESIALEDELEEQESPVKGAGKGRGSAGRGTGFTSGGRGRGGGRGGFMNFGERKDPPHKGEKVCYMFYLLIDYLFALMFTLDVNFVF
jgi:replication factor C subunit 1